MLLDLHLLTRDAFWGPFVAIFLDRRPHKTLCDKFYRRFAAGVRKLVHGVKHSFSELSRDERPGRDGGNVAVECDASVWYLHLLEL